MGLADAFIQRDIHW